MAFPVYNATVHPEEWVNQVQTQCIISGIRNDREVLKLCKLNIDRAITIPDVSSIQELITALKAHQSFGILKTDFKTRIDAMRFEGDDIAGFLAELRKLINYAEIDNPDEVRRRLLHTYSSNNFFRNEFVKRVTKTTPIDDMFKIYSDIVSDGLKLIKYVIGNPADEGLEFSTEQLITIKHVPTGRFLTSIEANYEGGSQRQIVFCGEKVSNENCAWFITYEKAPEREKYQADTVLYDDLIYLNHKNTKCTLSLNDYYRSPVSGQAEVHCYAFIASNLHPVKSKESNNKTSYLKVGDTIMVKSQNENYSLSSNGEKFTIDDTTYQEVFGIKDAYAKNEEWRIERYR